MMGVLRSPQVSQVPKHDHQMSRVLLLDARPLLPNMLLLLALLLGVPLGVVDVQWKIDSRNNLLVPLMLGVLWAPDVSVLDYAMDLVG
jgi:hypothetical protein